MGIGFPWEISHGMGWDRNELLWNGMGRGRKMCPMAKLGDFFVLLILAYFLP